jgi:acetyl esterase/lipase
MHSRCLFAATLVVALSMGCDEAPQPFLEARAAFHTTLTRRGATGQAGRDPSGPGIVRVPYESGGLALHAVLVRSRSHALDRSGRAPLLVYYHGGFALDGTDVDAVAPFLDAGFAVLLPALRAENGNPGDFEMFYGELDDARAALEHARTLRGIDPDRIVIFGHSAGGVLSALLSMSPDLGVVAAGSAGGLYDTTVFDTLSEPSIPFRDSAEERALRVAVPHIEQLRTPHWACVGEGDWIIDIARAAEARATAAGAPLELVTLPGDHGGSLLGCMRSFLVHARARIDAVPPRELPPEAPEPAGLAAARAIATSGAFDLAARPEGALLVWSAPNTPSVRVEALAADGSSTGPSTVLFEPEGHVREIEAVVSGEQIAVAWTTTDGRSATQRAFAAVGPIAGPLGAPVALGEVDPAALQTTRGNVLVAIDGDRFVAAVRGAGRCAAGAGCAQVVIAPVAARGARHTVPLEHACTRALVGAASVAGRAVVGLCDGTSLVRVALGDAAPDVSREDASCAELALLDAAGERRVSACPQPRLVGGDALAISCTDAALTLGTEITLTAPTSGLAAMLAPSVAPASSRATWTGQALLVAAPSGGELLLQRHTCSDGTLTRGS